MTTRRGFLGLLGVGAAATLAASIPERTPGWIDAPKKPLVPYAPRCSRNRLLTMEEIKQRFREANAAAELSIQRDRDIAFCSGDQW